MPELLASVVVYCEDLFSIATWVQRRGFYGERQHNKKWPREQ